MKQFTSLHEWAATFCWYWADPRTQGSSASWFLNGWRLVTCMSDTPRMPALHCSEKQAVDCLRAAGWSVEGAIEVFYSSGMAVAAGGTPGVDTLAIDALFLKYKGEPCCMLPSRPVPDDNGT